MINFIILLMFTIITLNGQTLLNSKRVYFRDSSFVQKYDTATYGVNIIQLPKGDFASSISLAFNYKDTFRLFRGMLFIDREFNITKWELISKDHRGFRYPSTIHNLNNEVYIILTQDQSNWGNPSFAKYSLEGELIEYYDKYVGANGRPQFMREELEFERILSTSFISFYGGTTDTVISRYTINALDLKLNQLGTYHIDSTLRNQDSLKSPHNIKNLNKNGDKYFLYCYNYDTNVPLRLLMYEMDNKFNLIQKHTYWGFEFENIYYPFSIVHHDILEKNDKLYMFGLYANDNKTPVISDRIINIMNKNFEIEKTYWRKNTIPTVLYDIKINSKGNFIGVGRASIGSHDFWGDKEYIFDYYMCEMDSTGEILWEKIWGDSTIKEFLVSVIETPEGTYIATGSSNGLYYICEVAPPSTNVINEEPKITDKIKSKYDKGTLIISIDGSEKNVGLYDINGKEIGKWETYHQNTEVIFEMSNFESGVYFIKASSGEVEKIIHVK